MVHIDFRLRWMLECLILRERLYLDVKTGRSRWSRKLFLPVPQNSNGYPLTPKCKDRRERADLSALKCISLNRKIANAFR